MKKVSLIIPVFNSPVTIRRCINSLLRQTYRNIEIIVVDDGSTDDTAKVCKSLEKSSDALRFFSLAHAGVSAARNFGMSKAGGDYIMFADADDYVREDYVERMVRAMESDESCDICICSYYRVIYDRLFPIGRLQTCGLIDRKRYILNTLKDPGHHYFGVLWNKIFRRRLITENNISFRDDITLGEDFVFSLNYLRYTRKVRVIDDRLYFYCYQRNDTLSRIYEKSLRDCEMEMCNRNEIFDSYVSLMKSTGLYRANERRIFHYWIVFYIRQLHAMRHEYHWTDEEKRCWSNEMNSNSYIKNAIAMHGEFSVSVEKMLFYLTETGKSSIKNLVRIVFNNISL